MRDDVTERSDAKHAAHIDQIAVAKDAAERRHRERHAEKNERPETGAVNELVKRHQQERKRGEAQDRQAPAPVAPQLPGMRRRIAHCASIRHALPKRRKLSANRRQFMVPPNYTAVLRPLLLRPINVSNRTCVVPFLSRLDSSRTNTSLRANVSPQRNKITRQTITKKAEEEQ